MQLPKRTQNLLSGIIDDEIKWKEYLQYIKKFKLTY